MPPNRAGSDRVGSLSNGLHGGNGAPRGTKLVDMSPIPLPPDSGLPPPGEDRFAPNELVLQHAADVTPQQIADLARRLNLTIVAEHTIGILNRRVYTLRIATRQGIREMIRSIRSQGLSVAVQPNYTYRFAQESKDSSGDPAQYAVARLRLVDAHRITRGKDVTVAVIDSAIDTDQPDLAGSVTDRFDAGCGSSPPDAHGTGMAGAIASHKRLLGVAPNTKIIAVCAFSGAGQPASSSIKVLRGLDYAVRRGARIVNMSFAGPRDPALSQALQIARENGVLVIAAVGNSGPKSPPLYPGADRSVLAVTATDQNDGLLPAANQGKYVSLAAPGVNILVPAPNGGLQFTTGTSVAAAHVSGVAALLLSRKPSLTPEEIRKALVATALHLGPAGHNSQYGAGLVDPLKALELIGVRNESSQNDPRQMLAAFNQSSERIENGFSVLGFARDNEKAQPLPSYRPHEWLAWLDVRGGDFSRSTFGSDLRGTQVNAIGGLTYRVTPDFLAGVLGGYERFDYSSQALNGRITGGGWTTGAYLGWRFASNLRVDAAAAWSNILSDAVSGTAAGTFKGSRWLLSGGVTGSYGWQSFVVEPSARLYGLWEHESSYLDSLGVLQRDRNFATGRASGGVKVSAPFDWSTVAAISPYMGLYSDYYFSRDDAIIAGLTGVPILHGWSARATAGITATMRGGAQFAAGAEYGGIGSSSHILSWRMRVWLPF
jgi:outer membrane autotransporter protein